MATVERVARVLSVFSPGGPPLSLTEISNEAGIPVSSAHRLVGELVTTGLLERDERNRYTIGTRVFRLGSAAPHPALLRDATRATVHDLAHVSEGLAGVSTLLGGRLVVLDAIAAHGRLPQAVWPGRTGASAVPAAGQIVAAFVDDQPEHAPPEARLARERGFATAPVGTRPVATSIAAPLLGSASLLQGVLWVVVAGSESPAGLSSRLAAAAGQVSVSLRRSTDEQREAS